MNISNKTWTTYGKVTYVHTYFNTLYLAIQTEIGIFVYFI